MKYVTWLMLVMLGVSAVGLTSGCEADLDDDGLEVDIDD